MTDKMADKIKHLVSKKKRRFIEDGFDLDLAYIKPNIIAMGFPSENLEGVYRNHLDDVHKFLEMKHKDKYKVYNLCSEKYYDPAKFGNRVSHYGFDDHNAPPFELIKPCCIDMAKWLDADGENVAIIHCKAGKGRTGVMICAYLLYKKHFTCAVEAMNYYADARTENKKGVTIPSQRRYISYFGFSAKNNYQYVPKTILLNSVTFIGVPNFNSGTCSPSLVICQTKVILHKSKSVEVRKGQPEILMDIGNSPVPICGDIKIDVFHKDLFKKERMLVFWFNTYFLEHGVTLAQPNGGGIADLGEDKNGDRIKEYIVPKRNLDQANKDKKHKLFPETFTVRLNITIPRDCDKTSEVDGKSASRNSSRNSSPQLSKDSPAFRERSRKNDMMGHGYRLTSREQPGLSSEEKHQTAGVTNNSNRNYSTGNIVYSNPTYPKSNTLPSNRNENTTFYFDNSQRSRVITDNTSSDGRSKECVTTKGASNLPDTSPATVRQLNEEFPRRMNMRSDHSPDRLSRSIEYLVRTDGEDLSDSDDDDDEITI